MKTILENKKCDCNLKIKKLKMTLKMIRTVSILTSLFCIIISTSIAATVLPAMATSILSACITVLTGIDLKLKFQDKNVEINQFIEKLNKVRLKLEYKNSCNGNLSEAEYQAIFEEFNTVL